MSFTGAIPFKDAEQGYLFEELRPAEQLSIRYPLIEGSGYLYGVTLDWGGGHGTIGWNGRFDATKKLRVIFPK